MATARTIKVYLTHIRNFYVSTFLYKGKEINDLIKNNKNPSNKEFQDVDFDYGNVNIDIVLDRIIKSYQLAKAKQSVAAGIYQVSNEWMPIYNSFMGDIISVLQSGDKNRLKKIYSNFMRESCSIGLHGLPYNMQKIYFKPKKVLGLIGLGRMFRNIFLSTSYFRYNLWRNLTGRKYGTADLQMPLTGNPYGIFVDGKFLRVGSEYFHYYSERIKELINSDRNNERKIVLELGGGYGGLAFFFIKNNNNSTYIDVDLPENAALTAFFLLTAFPKKNILLYGEEELTKENIVDYDAVIYPNFSISEFTKYSADLVFNSYSLAEMDEDTIKNYVKNIKVISSRYIYHVNHTTITNSLGADDFGFDADNEFSLLYKAPAQWNLMLNYGMDEYEYLYKKR